MKTHRLQLWLLTSCTRASLSFCSFINKALTTHWKSCERTLRYNRAPALSIRPTGLQRRFTHAQHAHIHREKFKYIWKVHNFNAAYLYSVRRSKSNAACTTWCESKLACRIRVFPSNREPNEIQFEYLLKAQHRLNPPPTLTASTLAAHCDIGGSATET